MTLSTKRNPAQAPMLDSLGRKLSPGDLVISSINEHLRVGKVIDIYSRQERSRARDIIQVSLVSLNPSQTLAHQTGTIVGQPSNSFIRYSSQLTRVDNFDFLPVEYSRKVLEILP